MMATRRVPSFLVLVAPVRTRYYFGRLLTAEDFEREQEYHRKARFRLNLALLGAGVVWGLGVSASADDSGLEVSPGMAIDGLGREIIVPCRQVVALKKPAAGGAAVSRPSKAPPRMELLLGYREDLIHPMPSLVDADSGEEPSLIRETFRLWCAPARKVRGEPADPQREGAVVLAVVRVTAAGRVAARGIDRGTRGGR